MINLNKLLDSKDLKIKKLELDKKQFNNNDFNKNEEIGKLEKYIKNLKNEIIILQKKIK